MIRLKNRKSIPEWSQVRFLELCAPIVHNKECEWKSKRGKFRFCVDFKEGIFCQVKVEWNQEMHSAVSFLKVDRK